MDEFADFAALRLGKGVVRCNDAPMFVANRIGMFTTVHAMNKMGEFGLTVEEVDAASGPAIGRAVTATFGTADLAGSDILAHNVAAHASDGDRRRDARALAGPGLGAGAHRRAAAPATSPAAGSSRTAGP